MPSDLDFKRLTQPLKHAAVLNKILDAFETVANNVYQKVLEAEWSLNLDMCYGEDLDRVGLLLGIRRLSVFNENKNFLKTDDKYFPFDSTTFYVQNAVSVVKQSLLNDDQYRSAIRSQIFKNTLRLYTVDDFEMVAKVVLSDDDYSSIKATWGNFSEGELVVHVSDDMEQKSIDVLQRSYTDSLGRKNFVFPYPPTVKTVVVRKDL